MYEIEEIKNTIICGDSLYELKKIPDNSIDMVITSPPYNFDMKYIDHKDKETWEKYLAWLKEIFTECYRVLKPRGRMAINIQSDFRGNFPTNHFVTIGCLEIGFIWKAEFIWNKNHYNTRMSQFGSWKSPSAPCIKISWEYIEVFCKEDVKRPGKKEDIDITRDEFLLYLNGMWEFKPENGMKKFEHPAVFPEELPYRLMKLFSYKGDIILDPFNGVGTTSLVAKKNNRNFIGIELSKEYCDKAISRLAQTELFNG